MAKVSGHAIPPPRVLADQGRVGFADQVLESDGQVRRVLLTVEASDTKQIRESLRLALGYLAQRQITPQPLDAAETTIQLGRTVVAPLWPHHGGYGRANTGGYPLLLNHLAVLSLQRVHLTLETPLRPTWEKGPGDEGQLAYMGGPTRAAIRSCSTTWQFQVSNECISLWRLPFALLGRRGRGMRANLPN